MGKAKRLDLLKKSSLHNAKGVTKPKADNPFDKFANARKKFDILNRKVKGEDRNVGRARAKAVDERKKKLLTEFQKNKKTNVMIDKRFGENDPTMSVEEKMFLRFQRERMKKVRNSSIYNLDEDNQEFLTHKGSVLGESNIGDTEMFSSDEEESGKIHKDVVNKLHFGGGLVQKKKDDSEEQQEIVPVRKGRLEALQEIVMKSKLFKMQKKEAKNEQESERKRLDEAFDELFSTQLLSYDQTKQKKKFKDEDLARLLSASKEERLKSYENEKKPEEEDADVDEYDRDMHLMMFEKKVQPTDRTKTAEEIAIEEKDKLQELEKARLRRMRQGNRDIDEKDEEDLKYLSKRKRNDDELDEVDFGKDRRAKLNEEIGKTIKRNQETTDESNDFDDDEEEGDENEDDEEEGSDDFSGDEEDEDDLGSELEGEEEFDSDDEIEGEEATNDDDELYFKEEEDEEVEEEDEESDLGSDDDEEDKPIKGRKVEEDKKKTSKKSSAEKEEDDNQQLHSGMPHKIRCPHNLDHLDALIKRHCKNKPDDTMELFKRIFSWNSVHLPGEEGKENKKLMHNFLNVLIKYFMRLGDSLMTASSQSQQEILLEINFLTTSIFQLTQDLKTIGIPLYSRTIKIIYEQIQKQLRDYQQGTISTAMPSLGKIFFFQLVGHVFSVTDLNNPMVNISFLILTQILAQTPINSLTDLYSSLLICDVLLSSYNSMETQKLMPEVITCLSSILVMYLPSFMKYFPHNNVNQKNEQQESSDEIAGKNLEQLKQLLQLSNGEGDRQNLSSNIYYNKDFYSQFKHFLLNNIKYSNFKSLRNDLSSQQSQDDDNDKKKSIIMSELLSGVSFQWELFNGDNEEISESILLIVYKLIHQKLIPYYSSNSAFPELMYPIYYLLQRLLPHQEPVLSYSVQFVHLEVLTQLKNCQDNILENRIPLKWRNAPSMVVESKAPKYHIDYIIKRDRDEYDHNNKEKLQLKQLNRQLKREQKAAMRELRRDADFIEQEKYTEKQAALEKQRSERHKNFQWLEEQQATINLQVKKGGELMKGGGSFMAKKPRVKR
jgi:nucleolar protein 14